MNLPTEYEIDSASTRRLDRSRPRDAVLADDGYHYLPRTDPVTTARAAETFERLQIDTRSRSSRIPVTHPLVDSLLRQPGIAAFLTDMIGPGIRAVRAIAFDKTGQSNWFVPWHQDRTIAVQRRDDRADVSHWTIKSGNPHCEPPIALLESMVTLRWHLDPVLSSDGAVKVLPTTHSHGRLPRAAIDSLVQSIKPVALTAQRGDIVAMRPLLVHASGRRNSDGRRRIVHVEFAASDPPAPLEWARPATMAA